MNVAIRAVLVVCFLAVFAYADDAVLEFTFQTVDGKTIEYRATNKTPYVVNIGSHW